jgi:hypothetical protein
MGGPCTLWSGQRAIGRFALTPRDGDGSWLCSISRIWNLDRPDPR